MSNGKTDQSAGSRLRLSLRQLEVFVATARAGSTRAAAERVSRSQSAASATLAELEAVLGVQLFDRVGRRLLLNENGHALLGRAAALLDEAGDLQALFSGEHAAPLRLAASFTIGEYLLPDLVAAWTRRHPASPVRLQIANSAEVVDAVARFEVDLGFIEGALTHPELRLRGWRSDELVIVAAPDHPLAGAPAGLRQLRQAEWVLRERGSGTRDAADRWLLEHLGEIRVAFELGSSEAIKRLVARGVGLGCLSRHAVAGALAQGELVELRTRLPAAERRLAIVTHRDKHLGRAARAFLAHCTEDTGPA
ncbi:LysR family transcriptional regulator [Piscinibacter sakaiensis]|uniref:LysR family transcriptional regulator YeiE n=1 Tax=Piscinibacter sakaiensis TaxID=1547922 RepID=A0A0K8P6Y8_PISS1|nr:LysR family transcriptional regulator [Piscinibacter sakaiensis]GAP37985.1 LysR family transcriptional regulator YeiE [Piscinibacter sakaiensis]